MADLLAEGGMGNFPLEQWFYETPICTRIWTSATIAISVLVQCQALSPFQLFYTLRSVFVKNQLWRLATTFCYMGPLSLDLLLHVYFMQRYSRLLEESASSTAHYTWMMGYAVTFLLALAPALSIPFLGQALSSTLVYIWSRRNPDTRLSFMGLLVFPAPFLPWFLIGFSFVLHGSIPKDEICGIIVGHIYYFFSDVYPPMYDGQRPLDPPAWWCRLFERRRPAEEPSTTENIDPVHLGRAGEIQPTPEARASASSALMLSSKPTSTALRHDHLVGGDRRSVSGASTASNESGRALDSTLEHSDPKYAPIRPRSQQLVRDFDNSRTATPVDSHSAHFDDAGFAASLSQYNTGQQVDPDLRALQTDRMSFDMPNTQTQGPVSALTNVPVNNVARQRSRAASIGGATGTDGEKKERKGANNTQANEKELRELIERNHERTLESIARDVRNAERTQKSEKAKQLFAMRWLREFCTTSTESVPRNRVYTHYAQRCGTERVDTLNPASFGKLVRIIFPGIQTRRLGVRGESKYHYVSLSLVEDRQTRPQSVHSPAEAEKDTPFEQDSDLQSVHFTCPSAAHLLGTNSGFSMSNRFPTDTAAFPNIDPSFDPPPPMAPTGNPASQARLLAPTGDSGFSSDSNLKLYPQSLKFCASDSAASQDAPLELPQVSLFVPPKTDMDLANALTALYRTHCTSLVDSVRYVKEKQFLRLLGSFNGTMTVPVSRLFQQPGLAPWVKLCDQVMYQQIIRFVSQLALQVIPPQVFTMLRNISNNLTGSILKHFGHLAEHVVQAKIEAATIFCSLLSRLLRVNETAHAAANLLMNDEMRNLMWQDWVKNVRAKRVVESALSTCGHEEVFKVLTGEMRHLLSPLAPSEWFEVGTEYYNTVGQADWITKSDERTESIIERWATFLQSIPGRFPRVQTKVLMQYVESVGSACLRDITVGQAQSFGAWWITKVWIDEMMLWMAESGGFLVPPVEAPSSPTRSEQFDSFMEADRPDASGGMQLEGAESVGTRPDSAGLGINFDALPSFTPLANRQRHSSGPPTATFRFSTSKSNHNKPDTMMFDFQDASHDDSGIGMSLLQDG